LLDNWRNAGRTVSPINDYLFFAKLIQRSSGVQDKGRTQFILEGDGKKRGKGGLAIWQSWHANFAL